MTIYYCKLKKILTQYGLFYLLGFLIIFGFKYFYSQASSRELLWILTPTTRWVSILSGIPFVYESGAGYVNHNLRYIIAPSCSGVQFMIITMAMLIFSFIHRIEIAGDDLQEKSKHKTLKCWAWILFSILTSYLLTIFINGLRIIAAIYLPLFLRKTAFGGSLPAPDTLHTIIGTTVYFSSLLTIYHLADRIFDFIRMKFKNAVTKVSLHAQKTLIQLLMPPVFWYFFVVLGIPLLNRINLYEQAQFKEYAILITLVCMAILFIYYVSYQVKRHRN